MKGPEFICKNR